MAQPHRVQRPNRAQQKQQQASTSPYIYSGGHYPSPLNTGFTNIRTLNGEDLLEANMNIDPILQSLSPPARTGPWTPPQTMQRFLMDDQKAFFIPSDPFQTYHGAVVSNPVAPLPTVSQPRYGSPFSFHEPSSACSSALSPAGDSDYNYENTPTTPPDYTPSPFSAHPSFEAHWTSQPHVLQFAGAGATLSTNNCVNPLEVSTCHDLQLDFADDDSQGGLYDLPSGNRRISLEGHASFYERDSTTDITHPSGSPALMALAEDQLQLSIPNTVDRYYSEFEEEDMQEAIETPFHDDDNDADYSPTRRSNHPGASYNMPTRSRAGKRSYQATENTHPPKRQRFSSSTNAQALRMGALAANPPTKGHLSCTECKQANFKDEAGLQNHIKKQHTRPFVCVFNFAGCEATFASKNEWKRHVMSQHIQLFFWLCTEDACGSTVNNIQASQSKTSARRSRSAAQQGNSIPPSTHVHHLLPNGAIFNRKDLYTQHIRRMHMPQSAKKATNSVKQQQQQNKKSSSTSSAADAAAEWETRLKILQKDAQQARCALPTHMTCPVPGCTNDFRGNEAWDQRMEHVARHLDRAVAGKEPPVVFGGEGDPTLMEWAVRPDVAVIRATDDGGWELNNPLKPGAALGGSKTSAATVPPGSAEAGGNSEDDAEGELDI